MSFSAVSRARFSTTSCGLLARLPLRGFLCAAGSICVRPDARAPARKRYIVQRYKNCGIKNNGRHSSPKWLVSGNQTRKTSAPLGKAGTFAHPRQGKHLPVGQTGQQPGARRAFHRAPRGARAVAAGSRSLRRRCPDYHWFRRFPSPRLLLTVPPPSLRLRFTEPAKPGEPACRAPKTAFLVSRVRKTRLPYPKNSLFGVPNPQKPPAVLQKQPFWGPDLGKLALRAPKAAFLGS